MTIDDCRTPVGSPAPRTWPGRLQADNARQVDRQAHTHTHNVVARSVAAAAAAGDD